MRSESKGMPQKQEIQASDEYHDKINLRITSQPKAGQNTQ